MRDIDAAIIATALALLAVPFLFWACGIDIGGTQ